MSTPDPTKDSTGAAEPFDFESFINGTKLPSTPVPLYRVDHSLRIAQLDKELAALPEEPGDEREAGKSERSRLQQERDRLDREQADSVQEFELRALNAQEFAETQAEDADVVDQIALQSKGTRNEADRDTWERVAASVSAMQWGEFVSRANDLILSKVVVPDFSQTSSATTTTRRRRG